MPSAPRAGGAAGPCRSALVLSPWTIRNFGRFGEPIWTTTHGGYTLALANNPVYYRDVLNGPPGRVWTGHEQWLWADSITRETAGMSEPDADRYLRNLALRLAHEQPADFGRPRWRGSAISGALAPAVSIYPACRPRGHVGLDHSACFSRSRSGSSVRRSGRGRDRRARRSLGLTVVHAFYWTDMRMRAPIVPAIALVAAATIGGRRVANRESRWAVSFVSRITGRRRQRQLALAVTAQERVRTLGFGRAANTSHRDMVKLMPVAATMPTTAAARR